MATAFTERIYAVTARIPRGRAASYGQIAALAGNPRAARQVGFAMHACHSAHMPCHRVVYRDGSLCPQWPQQRALLLAEGVAFTADGRVDLAVSGWDGV